MLLAAGAPPDADAVNTFKVRPIHSAAAVRDRTSVRLLLEAGADPNVRQQGGYTPLHTARTAKTWSSSSCSWPTTPTAPSPTTRARSRAT